MEHPFVLCGKTLQMPATSATFLKSYLERVATYAKKYLTDTECVQDIEERILERLLALPTITEKDVVRIVNEIGEPNDIFKDMEKKSGFDFTGVVQDVRNTKMWARNEKDGWILGVCAGIADALRLPVWFIRVIFVATFFAGGSSFFVYVVAAFLMGAPIANNEEKKTEDTTNTITTPKDQTPVQSFFSGILNLSGKGVNGIFKIIGWCIVMFFLFWVLMFALGIAAGWVASLIGTGLLANHFVLDNQDLFAAIPAYGTVSLGVFGLGLLFLAALLVVSVFQRKLVGVAWYVSAILVLGVSFLTGWAAIFQTMSQYTASASTIEEHMIDVPANTKAITLSQLNALDISDSLHIEDLGYTSVRLEKSGDITKIKVQVKTTVRSNTEATGKKILEQLQPVSVAFNGGRITFSKNTPSTFKSVVPYSFGRRSLIIYLPENLILKRVAENEGQDYKVENSMASSEMQKYDLFSCRGKDLYYSQAQQAFICHDDSAINTRKRGAQAGYMSAQFMPWSIKILQQKGITAKKLEQLSEENEYADSTKSRWIADNIYTFDYKDRYLVFTLRVTLDKQPNGEIKYNPEVMDLVIRPDTNDDNNN